MLPERAAMVDYPATRAAAMALADEERLVQQGYDFLDEKRMLLAAEIMRQLDGWKKLQAAYHDAAPHARETLDAAFVDHGLEGLQVHCRDKLDNVWDDAVQTSFLGVVLMKIKPLGAGGPISGSGSAARCGHAFRTLLLLQTKMAAVSGNLLRLADEYRRTERRARALENVLLPEIAQALKTIEEKLEAGDQEEAIRVRLSGRSLLND
jgi:V/A-type H+-transporting ATPase subunit D